MPRKEGDIKNGSGKTYHSKVMQAHDERVTDHLRWMDVVVAESQVFSGRSPPSNGFTNFIGKLLVLLTSRGLCIFNAHN